MYFSGKVGTIQAQWGGQNVGRVNLPGMQHHTRFHFFLSPWVTMT